VVLDPRYKMRYVSFVLKRMYGETLASIIATRTLETLYALFEEYASASKASSVNSENVASSSISIIQTDTNEDNMEVSVMEFLEHLDNVDVEKKSELDKYLNEDLEDVSKQDLDVLVWWKGNSVRMPTLSLMARDVLAIPVSTVASESAFSTGGRVLDPYRSSLTPRVVEGLLCTQDWLKNSFKLDCEEESLEDLEKLTNGNIIFIFVNCNDLCFYIHIVHYLVFIIFHTLQILQISNSLLR
jgi:hypothetical protein